MGILFALLCAFVLGTLVAYPLKLGPLGWKWHLGIGIGGMVIGWLIVAYLPVPTLLRLGFESAPVYLLWAVVGTIMAGLIVAIGQDES